MERIIFCILCLFFSSSAFSSENQKIALLFLTRDNLNQTEVWKEWCDPKLCNVYNHSKNPPSDPWLSQYRITEIHPTGWGRIQLAEQALLKEALKDPLNYKFIFLSESCVPLRTCAQVHHILTSQEKSHMNWSNIWWKKNSSRTLREFPAEHHFGNQTWIILNRKHAQMFVDDHYWIYLAEKYACSDESYPATFFSMHGVLAEFNNEATTYVDWDRAVNKGYNPYLFKAHTEGDFKLLMNAKINLKCLFARKFSKEFPSEIIKTIIEFGNVD